MTAQEIYKQISMGGISISTDTRTIQPGDIYVGIKGEQFDGNAFVADALAKGAQYVITSDISYGNDPKAFIVSDTLKTLQELATIHRQQFSIPVIAIGGSNGKTTTKELVHTVLATTYTIHTTKGNFNNEIGVPLTILAMKHDAAIAVIEIGANHPDEHTMLMDIVAPTHVLVTNNGADHLEGFGSLAGVRAANKEIYDWAAIHGATAFVDSTKQDLMEDSSSIAQRVLYPVSPYETIQGMTAGMHYEGKSISSQLFGSFNIINILASLAVGTHFSVALDAAISAIENYAPTLKRSQIIEKDGYTLILDCYNANPSSMELSLHDFFTTSAAGQRVLIVGDMFELGAAEANSHQEILKFLQNQVALNDIVLCVGPRFSLQKGSQAFNFFLDTTSAKEYFDKLSLVGKKIFIKGSRGMKLEQIL